MSAREDTKYCGNNCRAIAARKRLKIARAAAQVAQAQADYEARMEERRRLEQAELTKQIKARIAAERRQVREPIPEEGIDMPKTKQYNEADVIAAALGQFPIWGLFGMKDPEPLGWLDRQLVRLGFKSASMTPREAYNRAIRLNGSGYRPPVDRGDTQPGRPASRHSSRLESMTQDDQNWDADPDEESNSADW